MLEIGLDGSKLDPNRVITKYVKHCTYCFYVRCVTLIVRVGGISWSQTDATHCHAQLGVPKVVQSKGWFFAL